MLRLAAICCCLLVLAGCARRDYTGRYRTQGRQPVEIFVSGDGTLIWTPLYGAHREPLTGRWKELDEGLIVFHPGDPDVGPRYVRFVEDPVRKVTWSRRRP